MAFQTNPRLAEDLRDLQLHSVFAHDMLCEIAGRLGPDHFSEEMQKVFGDDIPHRACVRLWREVMIGEVKNPPVVLTDFLGYDADYDNRERVIRVDWGFFSAAVRQRDQHWWLLTALLHEFGHHIDNVLRQDLSDDAPEGKPPLASDAKGEEGHRFTAWMVELGAPSPDQVEIATYAVTGVPERLDVYDVSWSQARAQIRKHLEGINHGRDTHHTHPDREAFEAGSSDAHGHTHQTIEWVLRDFNFRRDEIDAVYFGNWLRDYSQVVDPKITRAPDMPKEFPALLSRQAWAELVDVLAAKKFPDLRMRYPTEMKVTAGKLGVYRPYEHIDNPLVIDPSLADPRVRDADFEPWVLPGDPLLGADRATSMKRYIPRSVDYMQQQLRVAMKGKRSLRGLRSFGAALHVLEDLFAHSNFTELSLIKTGHVRVLPWTTPARVKWNLPLVTGTFGGTDIIASLAAPLGKILYSTHELEFELTQPGYRSERDKVMLILLSEHPDQDYFNAFNALLTARDELITLAKKFGVDTLKFYRWLISTPAGILLNAYNSAAQGVLAWIGNSVADAQTASGSDPNVDPSIEPTHSQLSKDHPEHPLHDLAALLATEAVRQVTQTMLDYWDEKPGADPIAVASAFFCHPADAEWQYGIVDAWAETHPDKVQRAESKTDLDETQQKALEHLRRIHDQLKDDSMAFLDYLFHGREDQPSGFLDYAEKAFLALVSETSWWKAVEDFTRS